MKFLITVDLDEAMAKEYMENEELAFSNLADFVMDRIYVDVNSNAQYDKTGIEINDISVVEE